MNEFGKKVEFLNGLIATQKLVRCHKDHVVIKGMKTFKHNLLHVLVVPFQAIFCLKHSHSHFRGFMLSSNKQDSAILKN